LQENGGIELNVMPRTLTKLAVPPYSQPEDFICAMSTHIPNNKSMSAEDGDRRDYGDNFIN
jgi:hypothetical protein